MTIAGPGGSGKTRLAAQVAAEQAGRWPDGAWWVELGALVDPAQVAARSAAALGVLVDPARGAVDSLRAQLAGRRLLLCLDNCEHVLDAAAAVAGGLRACPEVTVARHEPRAARRGRRGRVAAAAAGRTTRWRCSSSGPPRSSPTWRSTTRPMRRSRRCAPGSTAPAGARARRRVAAHADAAPDRGRARRPLRAARAQPARRRAAPREPARLDGLEPRPARRRRTAPCSAASPCSPAASISRRRGRCARRRGRGRRRARRDRAAGRQVARRRRGRGGELRYRLLETIRQYAADRLRAAGERQAAADRHLDHRLAQVREAAPDLERDKDRWRATLARDHDNLRAAIEHGLAADDPTRARELAAELPWLWHLLRQGREGIDVLRRAIARAPDDRSALQARLLVGMALVADTAGPLDVELDAASRAAELAAEHGDERAAGAVPGAGGGRALLHRPRRRARDGAGGGAARRGARARRSSSTPAGRCGGSSLHLRDEHAEAEALLSEAAERLIARGERGVGSTRAGVPGRERAADRRLARRARARRAIGRDRGAARPTTCGSGWAAARWRSRSAPPATSPAGLAALEPVLPLVDGAGAAPFVPEVGRALGLLHLWAGDAERAVGWLAAEAASTDGGRPTYLAVRALPPLAAALRQAGPGRGGRGGRRPRRRARPRARDARRAGRRARRAGAPAGDREGALDLHHEALAIRAEHGLRPAVVESLEALATLGTGTPEQDARLLAAAGAARDALSLPAGSGDRSATLRAELGEGFDDAWAAGAALSLDEATAYARRARGSRRRPDHGWASLTPAEREVVPLAVEGLTNPEIGARLFMSRSTVKTHLSHVFAKLGVANRTELAAVSSQQASRAQ